MTNCADRAGLKRAYDRNLGYARFWLGAGMGIVAVAFAFLADRAVPDPTAQTGPPAGLNDTILVIAALLGLAAGSCFIIAIVFRHFYRQADAALSKPAPEKE